MAILTETQQTLLDQSAKVDASGESLLAVTGIAAAIERKAAKVNETIYNKAVSLDKVIIKKCKQFLSEEKFQPISLNLQSIDFLELQEKIIQSLEPSALAEIIKNVPQDLQTEYSEVLGKNLQTLKSLTPRLPVSITSNKSRPNDFEQSRFNRVYRTIDNPISILDDLLMGCLSRSQISVIINTYPNIYQLIKDTLITVGIDITSKNPEFQLPYPKLKQLSVLMLSNTVPPDLQTALQQNFLKQDQTQQPRPSKKVEIAEQVETPINRLQTK